MSTGGLDDFLPRERRRYVGGRGTVDLHDGFGGDLEISVGQIEEQPGDVIAEVVQTVAAARGHRVGEDAFGDDSLR
jgi:hypothetical protein